MKPFLKLSFFFLLCLIGCQHSPKKDPLLDIHTGQANFEAVGNEVFNLQEYQVDAAFGELVYVPIYSSIFQWGGDTHDLTATLSIHNVDLEDNIRLIKVNYYNTKGKLLRRYIKEPIVLTPLQTSQFIIKQMDKEGGTGANFVVQWVSESDATSPIVEAVMISTSNQQGLSFTTPGKVIRMRKNKSIVPLQHN